MNLEHRRMGVSKLNAQDRGLGRRTTSIAALNCNFLPSFAMTWNQKSWLGRETKIKTMILNWSGILAFTIWVFTRVLFSH